MIELSVTRMRHHPGDGSEDVEIGEQWGWDSVAGWSLMIARQTHLIETLARICGGDIAT